MNISDEAVEAAHKAWRAQAATEGTIFEYNLRAALEAAAPYIRAQMLEKAAAEVDEGVPAYGQGEYADWLRERAQSERSQS
jgi:hypothetical protein